MSCQRFAQAGVWVETFGSDFNFREIAGESALERQISRAFKSANIEQKTFLMGRQAHTTNVDSFSSDNKKPYAGGWIIDQVDGLITDQPGVALVVKTADCAPIIIFDTKKRVLAAVHSGWRGTAGKISILAIDKMKTCFDCGIKDMIVFLGPMIDQQNYEVGGDVYEAFSDFGDQRSRFFVRSHKSDKFLLDMVQANLAVLELAGIKRDQIEICSRSTFSDMGLHSARRQGEKYGLNGTIAMIR